MRLIDVTEIPHIVIYAGLLIGAAFGVVAQLSGFCLLSGLRGWWGEGDGRMIRSIALALAVAVVGTQLLAASGIVEIQKSLYLQPSFSPSLILIGGLLFGYGMVLANGCASRALILLGRGNLRSLVVVVVIGVAAAIALKGVLAPARLAFLNWSAQMPSVNSLPALAASLGIGGDIAYLLAAALVGAALLMFALAHADFRGSPGQIAAAAAIGLLVPAGWFATGYLGADDFSPAPLASLSFVGPIADTLQYGMLSSALSLNFGIALAVGTLAGSVLAAALTRRFQVEGFSSIPQMLRSVCGAALMGSGGAMAYGCSIGQGLTGLSTLALPSLIAATGIVIGAAAGLRGPIRVTSPARTAGA
ncbi:MAG: YeeE/YedE family protein [Hyphomicrobiales bacterium]|nr:YeeE/YedE family protein [Hyphomicrobiales bacterium]